MRCFCPKGGRRAIGGSEGRCIRAELEHACSEGRKHHETRTTRNRSPGSEAVSLVIGSVRWAFCAMRVLRGVLFCAFFGRPVFLSFVSRLRVFFADYPPVFPDHCGGRFVFERRAALVCLWCGGGAVVFEIFCPQGLGRLTFCTAVPFNRGGCLLGFVLLLRGGEV